MKSQTKKENLRKLGINIGIGASKAVLIALFAGAVVIAPGGVAGTLKVLNDLFEGKDEPDYDREQLRNAINYLRRKKLIDIQGEYEKVAYVLTRVGWLRARKLAKSFGILKPKKWDGKWRAVIFDIPVNQKDRADSFRQCLKNLGLANLQKSIWIHPYDCRDQIYYLARDLKIERYIRYIIIEEITGERDLRRRFEI